MKKMIDLTALSLMLSISQLFRDSSSYTTTHGGFSTLKDLWELITTLGLHYSGIDFLQSYCDDDRYRLFLQHLMAKPTNMLSNPELASLNLRYGWSGTIEDDMDMNTNVSTMDPSHPQSIKSFYDVVHLRRARLAKQGIEIQTGGQEDWKRALTDWKAGHIRTSVHAEVKLALICYFAKLHPVVISVFSSPFVTAVKYGTTPQIVSPDNIS